MNKIICVDLDGTLIASDTLHELLLVLVKKNFLCLFFLPLWLFKGKAYFKYQIAKRVAINPKAFPYNKDVLDYIREQKKSGSIISLVTAANSRIAEAIADHLGFFDYVFASCENNNLSGLKKAKKCNEQFGEGGYTYIGNAQCDLKVWKAAREAVVVSNKKALINKVAKMSKDSVILQAPGLTFKGFLKAIRVHQYVKNLLIFLPFLVGLSQHIFSFTAFCNYIVAFCAFSLAASSVYLLNDMCDVASDRQHPTKCKRAIASGAMSMPAAFVMVCVFLGGAIALSSFLPIIFAEVLLCYLFTTLLYSFYLKSKVLIDVITLAGLYTIRVLAGMYLSVGGYSSWLLMFSLFFFASLAFLKRFIELDHLKKSGQLTVVGRGYHVQYLLLVQMFGITSGYISAMIFSLYLNSDKVMLHYKHCHFLYLMVPIILYWISRIWLKSLDGKVNDDPVVYAIQDRMTWLVCIIVTGVYLISYI